MRPLRLAVLASHPIQNQVALFRVLSERPEVKLKVFFYHRSGLEETWDPGFGVRFSWDIPLLTGYSSSFLRNAALWPFPHHFMGAVNPEVLTVLSRSNFDAVWLQGWALATDWMAWAAAAGRKIPILLRCESSGLKESGGLKGTIRRELLTAFFDPISAFLAIGSRNAHFYKSYGIPDKKIFRVPYAVNNSFFTEQFPLLAGRKKALREKEGLPSDLPVILFCGKFIDRKRPLDLLKAFAALKEQPKTSLVFIGNGPLHLEMERWAAQQKLENVYFLGFRNQSEMPACYAMADFLVLPSAFEPWGLVLNEAMCCGLPVIASDQVGAAADLVKEGVNGFTYPTGSTEALADRFRRVLANPSARQEMGRQSREIISHWGIQEDIEGIFQCLRTVADNPGR